jgi:hypothetical protein
MPSSQPPTWANLTPIANLVYRVNALESGVGFSTHGATSGEYSTIDLSAALVTNSPASTAYIDMSNGLIMPVFVDTATLTLQLAGGLGSVPYNIVSPIFSATIEGYTLRVFNSTAAGQPTYPAAYGMIQFTNTGGTPVIGVVAPQEACRFTYSSAAAKWYKIAGV